MLLSFCWSAWGPPISDTDANSVLLSRCRMPMAVLFDFHLGQSDIKWSDAPHLQQSRLHLVLRRSVLYLPNGQLGAFASVLLLKFHTSPANEHMNLNFVLFFNRLNLLQRRNMCSFFIVDFWVPIASQLLPTPFAPFLPKSEYSSWRGMWLKFILRLCVW